MIRVIAKYAFVAAVALSLFSLLRVLVMTDVLNFDIAVTVTAALFIVAGIAFGIWFSRLQSHGNKTETVAETSLLNALATVQPLPVQALLSKREMEVFEMLLQNKTNQQISDALFIETSTLKTHINRIYKKLEVTNRRQIFAKYSSSTVGNAGQLQSTT